MSDAIPIIVVKGKPSGIFKLAQRFPIFGRADDICRYFRSASIVFSTYISFYYAILSAFFVIGREKYSAVKVSLNEAQR